MAELDPPCRSLVYDPPPADTRRTIPLPDQRAVPAAPQPKNVAKDTDELERIGQPVIYADAPRRNSAPQTSVLFRQAGQSDESGHTLGRADDALFMEVRERDPEYTSRATHNQAEDLLLNLPHFSKVKSRILLGPDEKIPSDGKFQPHIT
jgi:hypothetical protein